MSNISKPMLLCNGLLVLFVLLAGFPWNMARPQLHLLSLTVKKTPMWSLIFHTANPNLQYKTHPEFWPHKRIFKTCLYYTTCLILENWFCPTILRPMHCQADLPFLVLAFVSAGSPAPWGTPSSHPAVSADDPHMSHAVCPLALTLQPWGVYRSVFLWELCKCLLKWI